MIQDKANSFKSLILSHFNTAPLPLSISRFINSSQLMLATLSASLNFRHCVVLPDPGAPITEQIQPSWSKNRRMASIVSRNTISVSASAST